MTTYPGGKNGAGCYQTIINQIPPHGVYVEAFLGSGAIMRLKRPAERSIALDLSPAAIEAARAWAASVPGLELVQGDALYWLELHLIGFGEMGKGRDWFIYLDPPYPLGVRKGQRRIYEFELSDGQHEQLLRTIKRMPCMCMISSYPNKMYDETLRGWRRVEYQAMTRGGRTATECLWMNYPSPTFLHDWRYLGRDFRERERIKRKVERWMRRLQTMPDLERSALLAALQEVGAASPGAMMHAAPVNFDDGDIAIVQPGEAGL